MVSAHKKIVRREVRETCNLLMYWLEIFPHSVDLTQSVIYIFWNEFDYFISAMAKVLGTSYTVVAVTTPLSKSYAIVEEVIKNIAQWYEGKFCGTELFQIASLASRDNLFTLLSQKEVKRL